jgi:hypothetical protein
MTVTELITLFRQEVRDVPTPQLWSDDDIVRYINSALNELAMKADYFYDTASYAGLRFIATDPLIPTTTIPALETNVPSTPDMSPILWIRRAKVSGQLSPLQVLTLDQVENGGAVVDDYGTQSLSNWETSTGTPQILITDMEDDKYRLAPIPTVDGTLDIIAFTRPRFVLSVASDSDWGAVCATELKGLAGIKSPDHEQSLVLWMKRMAYLKDDADTYDVNQSERFGQLFNLKADQIKRELKRRRFPQGSVYYGGL